MYRIHHTIDPTNISIVDEEMDLSANNTKSAENVLEIAREPSKLDFHFSAVFAVASPTVQQQQQHIRPMQLVRQFAIIFPRVHLFVFFPTRNSFQRKFRNKYEIAKWYVFHFTITIPTSFGVQIKN